jgi:hypothetical protein
MSLLRTVRAQWSGVLRPGRYDRGGRRVEPDVTSTGMNTFDGLLVPDEPAALPKARKPRRAALVTALSVLTVVGAAGAYLGVVTGLGSILNGPQAEAGTVPARPDATLTSNSGIGLGPEPAKSQIGRTGPMPTTTPVPAHSAAPPADTTGTTITAAAAAAAATTAAAATATRTGTPTWTTSPATDACVPLFGLGARLRFLGACTAPPVPTPTAPQGDPARGDSGNPGDGDDPWPGETFATPGDSADSHDSPHARHRRWHH